LFLQIKILYHKNKNLSILHGGFKPTFISGGVQGDRIREIKGTADIFPGATNVGGAAFSGASGAFSLGEQISWIVAQGVAEAQGGYGQLKLNPSAVVPTGPDNAPANLSFRFWRRVS
jgi:hypothetical protein